MRLFECASRRSVGKIQLRQLVRPRRVAAASRIELGAMVGKRERMLR